MDRPERHIITVALAVALLGVAPVSAEPLELGVFAPRLFFATPEARDRYAQEVASVVGKALGHPVHGRAFANATDVTAFIRAKRLDLALLDVAYLASGPSTLTTLAEGTGPQGRAPPYAVLGHSASVGVNSLEGKPLALPRVVPSETRLLSNYSLEGEVSVETFFGRLHWTPEFPELVRRIRNRLAAGTIAYQALAKPLGLHVVAKLKGMPLPVLVEVGPSLTDAQRQSLGQALSETGLELPVLVPLTHLVTPQQSAASKLRAALALSAGQRPVRRAIWSPLPVERLTNPDLKVGPRSRYPLQTPAGRWRVPDFPDIQ